MYVTASSEHANHCFCLYSKEQLVHHHVFVAGEDKGSMSVMVQPDELHSHFPQWQEINPEMDSPPPPFVFTDEVCATSQMDHDNHPVDFFRLLWDDHVIHLLVEETNR